METVLIKVFWIGLLVFNGVDDSQNDIVYKGVYSGSYEACLVKARQYVDKPLNQVGICIYMEDE